MTDTTTKPLGQDATARGDDHHRVDVGLRDVVLAQLPQQRPRLGRGEKIEEGRAGSAPLAQAMRVGARCPRAPLEKPLGGYARVGWCAT